MRYKAVYIGLQVPRNILIEKNLFVVQKKKNIHDSFKMFSE